MRKGFLLANKKETRRTQLLREKDYDRSSQTHGASRLSMKQGFLLRSSSSAETRRKCNQQRKAGDGAMATTLLPQCTVNKKRVVTATSAALLDVENSMDKTDGDGAPTNDNIVPSLSLIKLVDSSVESTCTSHSDDDGDESTIYSRQPKIIVETDDRPVAIIAEENFDNVRQADSTNVNGECREENDSLDTANEMHCFAFAYEVSQLLSRLRRTLKSNDQSKMKKDVTNESSIGVRQFMNKKSYQLIKAFVEKHLDASKRELRLRQLWTLILDQIAQENTASSLKKKKKSINSISSQLALGVGVLEFSNPIGLALESIATVLSSLTSSFVQPINCDEEKQKRHKIEAIGAILLIQYHFRCMSIEASDEQTVENTTNKFERIEIETTMLMNKIVPELQSIVVNGQERTLLSATAADAFFELIEIFPRVCELHESSGFSASITSPLVWNDILPRIEEMIDVKRRWATKNNGGASNKIRATPSLFCNVSCQVVLPPLLEYMSHRYTTSNIPSSTSISFLLCDLMMANANEHADDFVGCLILSAQRLKTYRVMFQKNGGIWKSSLLASDEVSAYRNVLLAAAKSMVGMPSSTIPLSLFSCLVDTSYDVDATDSERKILIATVSVIRFAVGELRHCREFDIEDEQLVFNRFSPLLILRRLPKAYYQSLLSSDTEISRTAMCELATELASGLKAHALKNDERNLALEEKALLAQVAGHCLPFSVTPDVNDSPISLFDLCKNPFFTTLDVLSTESITSLGVQSIRESKAALFAVCQHIPAANDDDISGDALINVASFVFDFLLKSQTKYVDETERELAKLQTGCFHFLGVVFDSLFNRKAKYSTVPQIKSDEHNCRKDFLCGLKMVFDMTTSVLFNGAIDKQRFSASTRTSIFNSMIIYSQSCTTEDQRLASFASEVLPVLLAWVDEGPVDDDIRHPLAVAASLQIVYTIFAKIGSFDWVTDVCNESEADFVRLTLRCALRSLCVEGANIVIVSRLRLAALKVILTVIAIQPKKSGQNMVEYLEPIEVRHAVASVRGAANGDQSREVRQLAFEILPHLEHMIDS